MVETVGSGRGIDDDLSEDSPPTEKAAPSDHNLFEPLITIPPIEKGRLSETHEVFVRNLGTSINQMATANDLYPVIYGFDHAPEPTPEVNRYLDELRGRAAEKMAEILTYEAAFPPIDIPDRELGYYHRNLANLAKYSRLPAERIQQLIEVFKNRGKLDLTKVPVRYLMRRPGEVLATLKTLDKATLDRLSQSVIQQLKVVSFNPEKGTSNPHALTDREVEFAEKLLAGIAEEIDDPRHVVHDVLKQLRGTNPDFIEALNSWIKLTP